MKKLLSFFLSLILTFSLVGCSPELTEAALDIALNAAADVMTDAEQEAIDSIGGQDGPPAYFWATEDGNGSISPEVSSPAPTDETTNTVQPPVTDPVEETLFTGSSATEEDPLIDEDGLYYSKEDVSLYLITYGELPDNYITKEEARDMGWTGGSVEDVAPGYAIGGDVFGNYEGLLPKAKGRTYYECDIDTDSYHSRGSRRIVFSNDGLIYYTHDHYDSFELLYGEE